MRFELHAEDHAAALDVSREVPGWDVLTASDTHDVRCSTFGPEEPAHAGCSGPRSPLTRG